MTQSALYAVALASTEWQNAIQNNQEITATTLNLASQLLSKIYNDAETDLSDLMEPDTKDSKASDYDPKNGMPPSSWSGSSDYASDVSEWSTYYNEQSQYWQTQENNVNTPIQAMTQQEQSEGDAAQQSSQTTSIVIGPGKNTASLLSSPL